MRQMKFIGLSRAGSRGSSLTGIRLGWLHSGVWADIGLNSLYFGGRLASSHCDCR